MGGMGCPDTPVVDDPVLPLSEGPPVSVTHTGVKIVHQIYGLFSEHVPMSAVFSNSHQAWQKIAEGMSAEYHLWNADELESLVKNHYPGFWDMYVRARFPVMRCDIGRYLILHHCGGMYADLDTMPTRTWYAEVPLALQRMKYCTNKSEGSDFARVTGGANCCVDMEVIVAEKGNAKLLEFVQFMQDSIELKPWKVPETRWHLRAMRYISHTTGARSLYEFLCLPSNAGWLAAKGLHYLECDYSSQPDNRSDAQNQAVHVLTSRTCSYHTEQASIHVPVGTGTCELPCFGRPFKQPLKKRSRLTWSPGILVSRAGEKELGQTCDYQQSGLLGTEVGFFAKFQVQELEDNVKDHCAHKDALIDFIWSTRNSPDTQHFLKSMPPHLAHWLAPALGPHFWPRCDFLCDSWESLSNAGVVRTQPVL